MSKLSVITVDGVTFTENCDSDSGLSFYVAHRPFLYGDKYVEVLDLDAFWRWVIYQYKISKISSSGLKFCENSLSELMNEAMDTAITANEIWNKNDCMIGSTFFN